ncbi:MAG: hypothetical protein FGM35_00900 [Rhodocyclaceae bacterium]|nr:hypothetical protein [Rhodocyclaceae bacterium]
MAVGLAAGILTGAALFLGSATFAGDLAGAFAGFFAAATLTGVLAVVLATTGFFAGGFAVGLATTLAGALVGTFAFALAGVDAVLGADFFGLVVAMDSFFEREPLKPMILTQPIVDFVSRTTMKFISWRCHFALQHNDLAYDA